MFLSKKNRIKADEISTSNSIIGKGTTIEGDVSSQSNIRIEGKVLGSIQTKAKLAIGPGAYIKGNIHAQNVEVAGRVEGKIEVVDTLILKAGCMVVGDIVTTKLIVESGAILNGSCKMGAELKKVVPKNEIEIASA